MFRRLGELPIPSFAFVNGAAMGGGLEVGAPLHLPDDLLGRPRHRAARVLPRAGAGLGRHPAAAAPDRRRPALKLIIENPLSQNRMLKGAQAIELGIADAMFEPADFLEESLRWAARVLAGDTRGRGHEDDEAAWDEAVTAARLLVDVQLRGAAPAPYRALDLIALARTALARRGLRRRGRGAGRPVDGRRAAGRALLLRPGAAAGQAPGGRPRPALARKVTKVGVVGAGLMASQMALLFARRLEVPVVLTDLDEARLGKGVAHVHAEVDKLLAKGRVSADTAANGSGAGDRLADQGRVRRRRLRHRGGVRGAVGQAAGVRGGGGGGLGRTACSRPTPPRSRWPRWPPGWRTRSGWSGSTSSTRSR